MASHVEQEIRAAIAAAGGAIPFADFMRIALYHPEHGYYTQPRPRVGFGGSTDFFTATSTGQVFGELVVEAARRLLEPDDPADFSFVEIGAEPGVSVLPSNHPFRDSAVLRLGECVRIPERAIVFSNELFDAQPFHRLVASGGTWRELGVTWRDGFAEALLPGFSPPVRSVAARLPSAAVEGYHLDLPIKAAELVRTLANRSDWTGLLLVFDYGKTWTELIEATPQGTARAYRRHRQSNDLLADPGEQDLTCHICWDWIEEAARECGFHSIALESQEAFLVKRATAAIETIITANPARFDPRRQTLQQLLHPGNMGQKFQVLSARR